MMNNCTLDENMILCQRAIYIADILKRYVVCSVSWLKTLSLDELRWLFYSKAPEY